MPEFSDTLCRVEYVLFEWEPELSELSELDAHEIHGYVRLTGNSSQSYYVFYRQVGSDFVICWQTRPPFNDKTGLKVVDVSSSRLWTNAIGRSFVAMYSCDLHAVLRIAGEEQTLFCCAYGEKCWMVDMLHIAWSVPAAPTAG